VIRPQSSQDDAIPNANALIAQNLVRLALYSGDDQWRERADRLFELLLPLAADNLFSHIGLLNALDLRLRAAEIVVIGGDERLCASALKLPYLNRIVLRARTAEDLMPAHPARAAFAHASQSAALVCVGEKCSLPVTDADKIAHAVAAMHGS
jgi:uncharacterized protein YyaL (SSP411 family)